MTTRQGDEAHRLLVVSNRLPFTATEEGGELVFAASAGGVASGLSSYLNAEGEVGDHVWIGWPGSTINDAHARDQLKREALARYRSYPVFLSEGEMENFYHGFCNKIIWPLFHYFPSYAIYKTEYWDHYKRVNEAFCRAVAEIARPGDEIWVHDYHLMLLPGMLRERLSGIVPKPPRIGFFLHIPFPAYELLQLMPGSWRTRMLQGLLGADLVGFHTYGYTQNFLRSALRHLGYDHDLGVVQTPDHLVKADTFPMGIDFSAFHSAVRRKQVASVQRQLAGELLGAKVVLSVDRLDYTKGIINRLEAFELFLERYPDWRNKVVLALVIVPSRVAIEHYNQTRSRIEELVGRINGRFGNLIWAPIAYQYRSLDFEELAALYCTADVALVTPLRDGMNLIAKEYVASRADQTGVLILSETAGAARELGEALIVNPNSREEIAGTIDRALQMPAAEQRQRTSAMQQRLRNYDIHAWAQDFLQQLREISGAHAESLTQELGPAARERLVAEYGTGRQRLILLDYDGTLSHYEVDPKAVRPTARLLEVLGRLAHDPANQVVLASGRDRGTLDEWFGGLPLAIIAEHGAWAKDNGDNGDNRGKGDGAGVWHSAAEAGEAGGWRLLQPLSGAWKGNIKPILDLYAGRVPGSFVEEKSFSLVWHYRGADPELASVRTKELLDQLVNFTMNRGMQVLPGNKTVEVRTAGASKGAAVRRWLDRPDQDYDFILAAGDDRTDEDLFRALPDGSWSIKVGGAVPSRARCQIGSHQELVQLLDELAHNSQTSPSATTTMNAAPAGSASAVRSSRQAGEVSA